MTRSHWSATGTRDTALWALRMRLDQVLKAESPEDVAGEWEDATDFPDDCREVLAIVARFRLEELGLRAKLQERAVGEALRRIGAGAATPTDPAPEPRAV